MLPRFLYPVLAYRSMLFPFLVVSMVTVPAWLAFRLYHLRRHGRRPSLYREILLLTFVVYLSGLASATLTPNHGSLARAENTAGVDLLPSLASLTCYSAIMPEDSSERGFCVRNARGNVILFFPLGILIPLVWGQLGFWRVVHIAIALSVSIELTQYLSRAWGSYRLADVNDVILNVFGAGLGLGLVSMIRLCKGTPPTFLHRVTREPGDPQRRPSADRATKKSE
jgi:glycopeptide antibiotics resistance protein